MVLHQLEADLVERVSAVRTRLRGHRSHRIKINTYKLWVAILDTSEAIVLAQLKLAEKFQGRFSRSFEPQCRQRPDIARQRSRGDLS